MGPWKYCGPDVLCLQHLMEKSCRASQRKENQCSNGRVRALPLPTPGPKPIPLFPLSVYISWGAVQQAACVHVSGTRVIKQNVSMDFCPKVQRKITKQFMSPSSSFIEIRKYFRSKFRDSGVELTIFGMSTRLTNHLTGFLSVASQFKYTWIYSIVIPLITTDRFMWIVPNVNR